jgi:hypothetical protein
MTDTTPVEVIEPTETDPTEAPTEAEPTEAPTEAPSETESPDAPSEPTTGQTNPTVQLGDGVAYMLSEYDVQLINSADPAGNHRNTVYAGQRYPALVTAVFSPSCVNLRVFLDGAGPGSDYWATSRQSGDQPSQWRV